MALFERFKSVFCGAEVLLPLRLAGDNAAMRADEYEKEAVYARAQLRQMEISNNAIQQTLNSLKHSGETVKFSTLDPGDRQRITLQKDSYQTLLQYSIDRS
jgi:hypothetical protein